MSKLISGSGNQIPYSTDIARGLIPGVSSLHKFGHNHAVGSTFENLWNPGDMYVYLTAPTILKVSSSNVNDTSAGTGARTMHIEGLITGFIEATEDVIMNGQTEVATTKSWIRIHKLYVLTAEPPSATAGNLGIIYVGNGTVTAGVPAIIYACIDPTDNQTSHGFYTIPVGETGFLHEWQVSSDSQKATEVQLRVREPGGVFQQKGSLHLFSGVSGIVYKFPEVIPEMSDIDIRCKVDAGTTAIECFWDIEKRVNGT